MSRRLVRAVAVVFTLTLGSGTAVAHGGSLRAATESLSVPTWLFLLTGGGVVGASFLLASLATDRAFVRSVHRWGRRYDLPGLDTFETAAGIVGVLGLVAVLLVGFFGPPDPLRNAAVLVVWVGWWAGYVMTVYLLGNSWPAFDPFRTVARGLRAGVAAIVGGTRDRTVPAVGAWPSVVGLLALVYVEVVTPLADDPRLLSGVVLAYGVLTVAGGVAFGESWFARVDPVSRVFRYYGQVAPLTRGRDGLSVRLPGMGLASADSVEGRGDVAFVVAVVWVTTFDGLVTTPAWTAFARTVVPMGVPALVLYAVAIVVGFGAFYGLYRGAAVAGRVTGDTYLTANVLARRFAPSLLAIAAGYHLAHFFGYFVSLSPALAGALANPVSPPAPVALVLPGWFGGLQLGFVLVGHLAAIWVAHSASFEVFPGRLQAIRSQYAFTLVMIAYTMVSMWIITAPAKTPPYL